MIEITEYVHMVHELIEKPRNDLRIAAQNDARYEDLLKKYEEAYMDKCLKIEEIMKEEIKKIERFKRIE